MSCAMGGSSGWDDSGDMHSGLQECDCASTIDRLIQHKDMCAGPFACDADACDMQWSAVWGRGEFASSRASLDQILGGLLRGTEVPSMPPQRLREMHQLLRAHVGLSAATSERLDAQLAAAVHAHRANDFRQCYETLDAVCDAYMPHHHHGGGGGGGSGNTTACFACAAQHNSTVGVNCTKDELGELCVPHQHHHYQPPCNCSVESSARQPPFACDTTGSLFVAERVHWARATGYYSQMHAGMGATPYPPGLGLWFSTPAQGQCLDGASIGDNGCTFRVLPRATVSYGEQFVQRGFRKGQDGKEVEGQSVVPEEVGTHALAGLLVCYSVLLSRSSIARRCFSRTRRRFRTASVR